MNKTLLLVGVLCAVPAGADWYFRGTPNGWNVTQLDHVAGSQYQTCQRFGSGDGNGGPRFKIDHLGDWSESYPGKDFRVAANQTYEITFSADSHRTSADPVGSCGDGGFQSSFPSLSFRGTPNGWAATPMELVADHLWRTTIDFGGGAGQRFKLDLTGDWSQDYGDNDGDHILDQGGADIPTAVTGRYLVEVNDQTLSYSLTPEDGGNPNIWYFRGTPNDWGKTPMESSDDRIFCTRQSFGSANPRFKVDHFGNWSESYPPSDYWVDANSTYDICFNAGDKTFDVKQLAAVDTQPPSVSANPAPGFYSASQSITLSASDDQDSNPRLYYRIDGTPPTTDSPLYAGEAISAEDAGQGVDLTIKTLAVDASGNRRMQSFDYSIGEQVTGGDFREETIYFMITTRFYDGDSSNNYYNRDRIEMGDPHWRGDFKGLIEKLDYIKDLGFTAIWITPPVENRSGLDYHGYHAYDWNRIDPRLESPDASYQDLIDAVHAHDMKIIQDLVINHSSNYGIRGKTWLKRLPIKFYTDDNIAANGVTPPYVDNLGDYRSPIQDDNDNPIAPQWFKDLRQLDPKEGPYSVPADVTPLKVPDKNVSKMLFWWNDYPNLDPAWYHATRATTSSDYEDPTALWNTSMANDAVDLCTECPEVRDYLNQAIFRYLDMGVDAIRVDTLKHMPREDALYFVNAWKAHKPGLFVFGEALVKGKGLGSELDGSDNAPARIRPWWYTRTTQNPGNPNAGGDSGLSVLDFGLFSVFRDSVSKGSFSQIGGIFASDWVYGDATKLVTFLQNHDLGPQNDWKYRFNGEQGWLAAAYNLLWTARGIPTLFYGAEIEFQKGKAIDPAEAGPDAKLSESGRAYFGDHLEPDTIAQTQSHPIYRHIKRLNQIRRAIPALQKAPMSRVSEWGAGMSYVRDYPPQNSYAVVGLAMGSPQSVKVTGVKNGTYRDAVTGNSIQVTDGSIGFDVAPYSAGIYVLDGPGKIGSDGTYLH